MCNSAADSTCKRLALTREDDEHQATRLATLAQAPWSPRNHAAFPPDARARAVELHRIGHQLAKAVRPGGEEAMAFVDVWMTQLMPRAAAIYLGSDVSRPRCMLK